MTQGPFHLLHVGCGARTHADLPPPFNQPPWREVRLDVDPASQPDIVASITDMAAVPAQSVHAVWSAHNIEHLQAHDVPRALAEFVRVLVPTGFAVITVPDLAKVADAILKSGLTEPAYVAPAGPVTPLDMLYGYGPALEQGNSFMAHRTGFTAETLATTLRQAGFAAVAVVRENGWNIWAVASLNASDDALTRQLASTLAYPQAAQAV